MITEILNNKYVLWATHVV